VFVREDRKSENKVAEKRRFNLFELVGKTTEGRTVGTYGYPAREEGSSECPSTSLQHVRLF
jgi:hypothetical protein